MGTAECNSPLCIEIDGSLAGIPPLRTFLAADGEMILSTDVSAPSSLKAQGFFGMKSCVVGIHMNGTFRPLANGGFGVVSQMAVLTADAAAALGLQILRSIGMLMVMGLGVQVKGLEGIKRYSALSGLEKKLAILLPLLQMQLIVGFWCAESDARAMVLMFKYQAAAGLAG